MSELSVADVLERAADLIEPEGKWTQGKYGSHDSCMCAKGAIYHVGAWDERADEALEAVYAILPSTGIISDRLVAWNDAPERTQAEVVAKLREAAALARAKAPTHV